VQAEGWGMQLEGLFRPAVVGRSQCQLGWLDSMVQAWGLGRQRHLEQAQAGWRMSLQEPLRLAVVGKAQWALGSLDPVVQAWRL